MKRGLLALLIFGTFLQLKAQDVIWSEDFSNGLTDWTVTTEECGNIFGGIIGEWILTSAVVDGQVQNGATGTFSVGTKDSYIASFNLGSDRLYVQGKYSISNNVFTSNLNGASLSLNDQTVRTEDNDTLTLFFADLMTTQAALNNLEAAIGLNSPSYTANTNELVLTAGNSTFTYQKVEDCGALWFWDQIGYFGNGALIFPEGAALSNTATNGTAIINPDFYTTGGIGGPGSPPFPQYRSELISPTIDLSNVSTGVSISFYQSLRFLNDNPDSPEGPTGEGLVTSLFYSTDDGLTWKGPVDINGDFNTNDLVEQYQTIPLPTELAGTPTARIKFVWSGDLYFWVLDDIQLVEREGFDMGVSSNFFAVYPQFITPYSQLDAASFLADVRNDGTNTAENVQLNLSITSDITGAEVYNSTVDYSSIEPDSLGENAVLPDRLDPSAIEEDLFNTPNFASVYTGTYSVTQDGEDTNSSNDEISFDFVVLDTTFSRYDFLQGTGVTGISPQDDDSYTYGSVFYMPNGTGYFARSMSFAVSNPEELIGRTVSILLYEWDGDMNGDQVFANPEEYSLVGFNSYEFDGSEVGAFIDVAILGTEDALPPAMEDDKFYLVMVQYFTEDNVPMFILASRDDDYLATFSMSQFIEEPRHFSAIATGRGENPDFDLRGFGFNTMPLVLLHIGDNNDLSQPAIINDPTSTQAVLPADNVVDIFPNPAADRLNLNIELTEMADQVEVNIFDVRGTEIFRQDYDNLQQGNFNYNLSELSAGIYVLKVTTSVGSRSMRFFVK